MEFLHMCSDIISRGNQCWHCKMSAVYKSTVIYRTTMYLPLSSGTMLLCCISSMVVKPMSEIAFSVFSLTNPSSDLNSLLSGTVTSGRKKLINIKSFYKHQQVFFPLSGKKKMQGPNACACKTLSRLCLQ